MLAPPGKRMKPEHSTNNPSPRPRSAENPSAVTIATGNVPVTGPAAFIVPSVTPAAAMVTSKPQQWKNAGMKFISYTPTTVTTTTGTINIQNASLINGYCRTSSSIVLMIYWLYALCSGTFTACSRYCYMSYPLY